MYTSVNDLGFQIYRLSRLLYRHEHAFVGDMGTKQTYGSIYRLESWYAKFLEDKLEKLFIRYNEKYKGELRYDGTVI